VLFYVEELSMLFTKQDHQRHIIPELTKLLLHGDGPADMVTKGGGHEEIPVVNLSALFTSAPEWFMTTIPHEAFGGGMMSRFLVCCLEDREIYSINIQAEDYKVKDTLERLAQGLKACNGILQGHIRGTDDAQEWVKTWYQHNETAEVEDERMLPHRNRKPANLLRIAMILSASARDTALTSTRLQQALGILDWLEPTLTKLYGLTSETVQAMEKGERRIMMKLTAVDGNELLHSDLVRGCSSYFQDGVGGMRKCILGLVEKGIVEPTYKNGMPRWPPRKWKLNNIEIKEENVVPVLNAMEGIDG